MTWVQEKTEARATQRLSGKIALVTGGSRGIGAEIALRLAQEGATIALTYTKNKEAADRVVAEIAHLRTGALAFKADASKPEEAHELVKELTTKLGRIDILVNNAGVWEAGPLDQLDVEQFDRVFDVNVRGVIATTKEALKLMPNGGRIINISSIVANLTMPGVGIYSASKAALNKLTEVWAQELGSRRITVNAVSPGTTETDMFNEAIQVEQHGAMIERTALKRIGLPSDIASVVAFLASEDAGWVTGQAIRTDGGFN